MTVPTDLNQQRVLVTGAGGFVGRHLVRQLTALGAEVMALTRDECDLSDRAAVDRAVRDSAVDIFFHLATSRVKSTPAERAATVNVNTNAGAWVLEALRGGVRALVLGSSTEYGASSIPMSERTALEPRGFFGATKAAGSLLFAATAAEVGIHAQVLRAFQVYGPGDKPARFVPTVLAAARAGRSVHLTQPGMARDWVWVGDVVDACIRAATTDAPSGSVFNIGTGRQTTNEELVDTAARVTGRSIHTLVGADSGREWDTTHWVSDPSAARQQLGWEPTVDLDEGLARCWAA